jgi:hypothetical protein
MDPEFCLLIRSRLEVGSVHVEANAHARLFLEHELQSTAVLESRFQ